MNDLRSFRIHIAAVPEAAWEALTDPEQSVQWYFGTRVRSTWDAGAPVEYFDGEELQITGRLVAYDPPLSFTHEFIAVWRGQEDDQGTLTWEIEPESDGCAVTLTQVGGHGTETAEGSRHLVGALRGFLERAT